MNQPSGHIIRPTVIRASPGMGLSRSDSFAFTGLCSSDRVRCPLKGVRYAPLTETMKQVKQNMNSTSILMKVAIRPSSDLRNR